MKPERVYLDQLTSKSKGYKVKVKVIEKGRAKVSPKKGVVYQTLVMEDEKGNKMRGALFGDQVEVYKEAITHNGQYEIANAQIKLVEEQWKVNDGDLGYQMSFGTQTIIQPIDGVGPVLPQYQTIASIPRVGDPTDRFDVLGIVLYLEEEPRTVIGAQQRENLVREIVISDHSTHQPMIISAWNDLAGVHCDPLDSWAEKFVIVGFTALRATSHKGFSLASSMSTTIVHDPEGDKAAALREWAAKNHSILCDRQARVLGVRNPEKERVIITMNTLQLKKAYNTLQEERHWLRVVIPGPQMDRVNAYSGCFNSKCGKRGDILLGKTYMCTFCSKKDVVSTPRVTFNFDASDGTDTMSCTSFTKDTEQLFKMTAADIFKMKHSDDLETFKRVQKRLQTTHFLMQVGPTTALSRNNVLQWCLKTVLVEDDGTT